MCFTPQNQKTSGVAKTSQGSKIKAKSIEMAPVIGKVLHQPVARVELINPWGWFCFRTSHPHEGYYDLQTRVVFGRHATPKKKKLFYLLKFLPNLRSSWIFVESKLHPKLSKKPPSYWFLHPLPHLHVSSLPTLDVFKPLSHRGWTIINQCTTIQQKNYQPQGGGSRSGPPSTVVLAQFWLVSLVVETILGISPSSCLYGKGYHWLISLAFQGDISFQTAGTMRKLSVHKPSFLQECSRCMDLFLCPKDLLPTPFFRQKKLTPRKFNSSPLKNGGWKMILSYWVLVTFQGRAVKLREGTLPPSWFTAKKGAPNTFMSRCTGILKLPTQTLSWFNDKKNPSQISINICIKFDSPPKRKWVLQWPHHINHHGKTTAMYWFPVWYSFLFIHLPPPHGSNR